MALLVGPVGPPGGLRRCQAQASGLAAPAWCGQLPRRAMGCLTDAPRPPIGDRSSAGSLAKLKRNGPQGSDSVRRKREGQWSYEVANAVGLRNTFPWPPATEAFWSLLVCDRGKSPLAVVGQRGSRPGQTMSVSLYGGILLIWGQPLLHVRACGIRRGQGDHDDSAQGGCVPFNQTSTPTARPV